MLIVEVALQGIRGFPATTRIALKPGINVAKNEDPKVRAALIDAIYHTLFPDPSRAGATSAWAEGRESRIALTFYGRDKATYRLLREAESGATRLFKFDPAQKTYGLLSESSLEAAQYVRVQQQLPDEVSYERLFLFAPESMPSRGGKAKTRSGAPIASGGAASPSGPGLAGRFPSKAPAPRIASMAPRSAPPRGPSMIPRAASLPPSALGMNALASSNAGDDSGALEPDMGPDEAEPPDEPKKKSAARPEERLAELDKLRKDLLAAQRAERAQAELDELNLMRVELSERAEQVVKLRQELVQLRKETPQDDRIANLPAGFDQKLRDFEALEAKFATENQRLFDEVTALENEDQSNYVRPLAKDPYFLAGLGGALAMLGLSYAVARPFVALGNVLGVMVAAGAAFHWVAQLEEKAKLGFRVAAARDRHQRLDRQRSLDTGATRRLMQELGIDTPSEVLERVNAFQAAQARVSEVEQKVTALIADPSLKRAEEELAGIKVRIEALEAEVLGASITVSADTIERRVSQMERELKAAGIEVPPRPLAKKPPAPAPIRTVTGDLLSTADLPPPGPAKQRIAQPRSGSTADFSPPPGEPLLRSPTLSGLPAWPPPGVDVSSDLPIGSGRNTPAPQRGGSLVGQPVRPPPRSPSIPGGSERRAQSVPSAPPPARSTSVPGVLAPNRPLSGAPARGPSQPPKPSLPPAPALAPAPKPAAGERGMFDFGGGNIGGEDEEEGGEGYGAGYGGGSGGGGKEKEAPAEDGLWAMAGGGSGGFGGASGYGDEGGGGAPDPDRSRDLVQAAVDLLQQDVDALTQGLNARLGQYLMALTDKRYQTATFGARGELSVVSSDGGEPVPYVELDAENLDLVDTALRLALIEAVLRKVRVPILFDDPFTDYPPKRRKLMSQMIGYLGSATQLVIATSHEDLIGNELSW